MLKQNIKVAADAIVLAGPANEREILVIKRRFPPYEGMWAIPGGFVEDDEDLEDAAIRELKEETGLRVAAMEQLYTFGKPGRDTRGRTITVVYYALIDEPQPVKGADDAAEAVWVPIKDITALAFDQMEMLQMVLKRL